MIKRLLFLLIMLCGLVYAERVWAGNVSTGANWKAGWNAPTIVPPRPIAGIRGFILLSLPGNIAQYNKGLIYHTQTNGTIWGVETLVHYSAPSSPGNFGTATLRVYRWCPTDWGTRTTYPFDDASGWTTTSGWSISGGVATHSGAGVTTLSRPDCGGLLTGSGNHLTDNRRFQIVFELSNWSSGSVTVSMGGKASGNIGSPNGTKKLVARATNTNVLTFTPNGSFAGNIDNVVVLDGWENNFTNLLDTSDKESSGSSTASEAFGEKNTTDDVEPVGFAKYSIQLNTPGTGSVNSNAAKYVLDMNVGTETKKAIQFESRSIFSPLNSGTTTGRWIETIRIKNSTGIWDMKWAHSWEGTLVENFSTLQLGNGWAGCLETFETPNFGGTGVFNSQGTVTVGNHLMEIEGPAGNWLPFNTVHFSLRSTHASTGLTVYNPGASPGSWLAHVP